MSDLLTDDQIAEFDTQGFLRVHDLLNADEVARYAELYEHFLAGNINPGNLRFDLGSHAESTDASPAENITQIMWPSALIPILHDAPLHQRSHAIARQYGGDDMEPDFDMMIDKAPGSNTSTPWHQDMSYWLDLPDTRSVSVWVALDKATVDNGCMWYVPGAHKLPLRLHRKAGESGHALECDASEEEGVPVPLSPGSAVLHLGASLHYSRGNSTDSRRRAFITNFRPRAMIEFERERGFDHGRKQNAPKPGIR